jgi:ADP-ribosylglycohydrolase
MGAIVEGWPYQRIADTFGELNELVPYGQYMDGAIREAGSTEDGVDRQKMMITAIIEKGGRVNAEDVRAVWLRDFDPEAPGNISEPFEGELMKIARTRVPARDLGRFCDYAGLVSFARACHPIGLINAGDVQSAIQDVMEAGQLYQTANSRGLQWACVTAVAIAAATKPGADVDSVLRAIFDNLDFRARVEGRDDGWYGDYAGINLVDEIKGALEYTEGCRDYRDMREAFDHHYSGIGMPYNISYANEIVTKGVCVFKMTNANLKDAIIAASNLGRDTDCVAAVAGGLAGSLDGTRNLPPEWAAQVDAATKVLRYTNNRRTLREHADGLYDAFKSRLRKMTEYADMMDY